MGMILKLIAQIVLFFALIFGIHTYTEAPASLPIQEDTPIKTSTNTSPVQTSTTTKATHIKTAPKTNTSSKTTSTPPLLSTSTSVTPTPSISVEQINEKARTAVINILCTTQSSGPLTPITGSGIIISDSGLILTNAHVAQYFLLKDFNNQKDFMTCSIRTGNPAYPTYTAELVYISPQWIAEHKNDIILESSKGTGEYDYALLRITGRIDGSALPLQFPFIPPDLIEFTEIGTPAVLVSYPAGFLGGQTIVQNLYQSSAVINISDRYTFGENTVDLISLGGSVVAQKGSSGGAVVDTNGNLIGLIAISSDGNTTKERNLSAITLSYINRDLIKNANTTIASLAENSMSFAATFNTTVAPTLTKTLTDVILKR